MIDREKKKQQHRKTSLEGKEETDRCLILSVRVNPIKRQMKSKCVCLIPNTIESFKSQ